MMYGWHDNWGWGDWMAMMLMMVVFWGAILAIVYMVVRSVAPGRAASGLPAGDAMRILDERFARGEIDADEYARRRDLLRR